MTEQVDGGAVDPPGRYSVGLDVGGTKVHAVLLDEAGAIRAEAHRPTVRGVHGVFDTVVAAVRELVNASGIEADRIAGVGIGVPGIVNRGSGTVEHAVNLGIEEPVDLAAAVSEGLGRLAGSAPDGWRVVVENDLNAAAVGAAHVLGEGDQDLAFVALGTGVAAGLLLSGSLRRGARRSAGEIGHLTIVPDGLPCACGQRGCLERYASGSALDEAWPARDSRPAPAELFEAAAAGDREAITVRDRFAWAVAAAVRVLALTCDVERIVIGGGVSALGAPLMDVVCAQLRREADASPFLASLALAERIRLSPAGVPVGAVGAALIGREDGY